MASSLLTSPSPIMSLSFKLPKPNPYPSITIPHLLHRLNSSWTGLKLLKLKLPTNQLQTAKKGPCRGRVAVYASLFGVGAPEALVIGVVALLVFGPKGLAEVARNLGKTLKTFQPTIRELQEVSREFKSTLEQEIGLNDPTSSMNNTYRPTSFPNENKPSVANTNGMPAEPYTSEDLLKVTEAQLAASGANLQTEASKTEGEPQASLTTDSMAAKQETPAASPEAAPVTADVMPAKPETSVASPEAAAAPEITSAASTEAATKTPSSEKADKERL